MARNAVKYNMNEWILQNSEYFLPPVCNKMMHQTSQLKVFFAGGPNIRKDYHIEEGEEFFYMEKGDMVLKVIEKGKFRDIRIREGEIFLLPARIPHSPQRFADTVGMVVERERSERELDGLRYHIQQDDKPTLESLYEAWFHCVDLGAQLAPIITSFFASEQCKTGKPIPGTIPANPPVEVDTKTCLSKPLNLQRWIDDNIDKIDGWKEIFPTRDDSQSTVLCFAESECRTSADEGDDFFWQIRGTGVYHMKSGDVITLRQGDTLMVPMGESVVHRGGVRILYYQPTPTQ